MCHPNKIFEPLQCTNYMEKLFLYVKYLGKNILIFFSSWKGEKSKDNDIMFWKHLFPCSLIEVSDSVVIIPVVERSCNSGCMEIPGCVSIPHTSVSSTCKIQVPTTPTQINSFQNLV